MNVGERKLSPMSAGVAVWRTDNRQMWERCFAACSCQPVHFSSQWMDYQFEYLAERNAQVEDLSHILVDGDEPVGLWPITYRVSADGVSSVESFESPLTEPLFVDGLAPKTRTRLVRTCLGTLEELTNVCGVREIVIRAAPGPGAALSEFAQRLSGDHPSVGCSFEMIADLTVDEQTRWRSLRSRYRSQIRRMQERAKILVLDRPGDGGLETLKALHFRVAGVATRGDQTWQLQRAAIDAGRAFVVTVALGDDVMGASLVHRTETHATYAVGAYDREAMAAGFHLGHVSQWAAMSHLAASTPVRSYTLGWRAEPGARRSPKVASIDHFKEGFASAVLAHPLFAYRPQASEATSVGRPDKAAIT